MPDALSSLARTAHFTAAARARESERKDALFSDPWAAHLAGQEGFAAVDRLPPLSSLWPVVRTRFLDDCLRQWLQDETITQVVLPAAGLDTRAYRLAWPAGTRLFEIDQPDMLAHKQRVLAEARAVPQCERIALSADLRHSWADVLGEAGFDSSQPAIWIVEGLLMYLDTEAVGHIMKSVSQLAAPGSCLGLDLQSPSLKGFVVEEPQRWLADLGWEAEVVTLRDVAERLGRWPAPSTLDPPPATSTPPAPRIRVYFISAQKQTRPADRAI